MATTSCNLAENVRYRDHGELLYTGRVQWHAPSIRSDRPTAFGVGAEAGGFGVSGDVATRYGMRDYTFAAGYGAVLFEGRVDRFDFSGRVGLGYGEVDVAGLNSRVKDNGIALAVGLEPGFRLTDWSRAYVHGMVLVNDGWQSSWGEAGIEFRPTPLLGLRVGYARNVANIQGSHFDVFSWVEGDAKVTTDGVVIGMTLNF